VAPAAAAVWTDVSAGVRVRQSRAFMMNSAVLADREHTIVIDPGVLPSELDDIAQAVTKLAPERVTLFLTHGHWDHVLGPAWHEGAEIVAHDRVAAEVKAEQAKVLAEAAKTAADHGETWTRGFTPFRTDYAVSGLHYTRRGPWHLVFRDAPGHSDSQLTLHLPDRQVLFAADMLSDVEIPMLDRPPTIYRATLEALRPLAENGAIETLVPGHGSVARGADVARRLHEDLAYLNELERRAAACAHGGRSLDDTLTELDAMTYRGKQGGPFPMRDVHHDNVRIAYRASHGGA